MGSGKLEKGSLLRLDCGLPLELLGLGADRFVLVPHGKEEGERPSCVTPVYVTISCEELFARLDGSGGFDPYLIFVQGEHAVLFCLCHRFVDKATVAGIEMSSIHSKVCVVGSESLTDVVAGVWVVGGVGDFRGSVRGVFAEKFSLFRDGSSCVSSPSAAWGRCRSNHDCV